MSNQIIILLILQIFLGSSLFGQANRKVSIIVVECQNKIPDYGCVPTAKETVAYHFENGALKNREVLMTGEQSPFEFKFPGDENYIYQNRYLISDYGDVYDYERRKIIFRNNNGGILTETADETVQNLGLVKAISDKVIVKLAVSNQEATDRKGFFSYNLKTNEFRKIRNAGEFTRIGTKNFAPNNKTLAVIERMKLVFYSIDAEFNFKKLRVVNLGYAVPKDEYDDDSEETPIIWTDNRSVLTQNRKGEIIKVDLSGKISVVRAAKTLNAANVTDISKDECGNYELYPCDKDNEVCRINLRGKKIKQEECLSSSNSFGWKY